jgi:mannose-6-phosphate isomerase
MDATERRPWGSFTVLDLGAGYKVKRIVVEPAQRLSYQSHDRRAEHWVVVAGEATVIVDEAQHTLRVGDAVDIPVGSKHRVANDADRPLTFIEVQRGEYLGEDDIVRFDDDYGRTGNE